MYVDYYCNQDDYCYYELLRGTLIFNVTVINVNNTIRFEISVILFFSNCTCIDSSYNNFVEE